MSSKESKDCRVPNAPWRSVEGTIEPGNLDGDALPPGEMMMRSFHNVDHGIGVDDQTFQRRVR